MCDTEIRRGCYDSPLSLLKNCDANALGKLCDTVSTITDETMAYANFPKRSLVKCFSARDKYEWHVTQTAELEDMEKMWSSYKEQTKRTKRRTHQTTQYTIHEGPAPNRALIVSDPGVVENKGGDDGSAVEDGAEVMKSQAQERNVKAARQTPSPLVVNEDILREALMVAEHFEESDAAAMSPTASSDPHSKNSPTEKKTKEEDRVSQIAVEQQRQTAAPGKEHGHNSGRNKPSKLMQSNSVTTPRQRNSSHTIPEATHPRNKSASLRGGRHHDDRVAEEPLVSPSTLSVKGSGAAVTLKHGKPTQQSSKTTVTPRTTPRSTKKAAESPRNRVTRSTSDRLFRGAFRGCLGSKHASVDFSSSLTSLDPETSKRHCSTGPSTRKFFGGSRLKKSNVGGGGGRFDSSTGSFGTAKFRTSGEFKASNSKAWK